MPTPHDQPLHHLPLIPEPILRRYRVFEPSDTRFRACARLLQALRIVLDRGAEERLESPSREVLIPVAALKRRILMPVTSPVLAST